MAPTVCDFSQGSAVEWFAGGVASSFFSVVYILAPVWILFCSLAIVVAPRNSITHAAWVPLLISICVPPIAAPWLLRLWLFQCLPKYFQYKEILEIDDASLRERMKQRPFIFTALPHGVISFGGICSAVVRASSPVLLEMPTAAASVILKFPFMKNVLGVFGLVDASKGPLMKRLRANKHVVLYLGGIAELFLFSTELILCVKTGWLTCVTQACTLSPPTHTPTHTRAHKQQVSFTLFWGLFGLPIPRPRPILYVRGLPLGLPKVIILITIWHGKYVAEVERLYKTYQVHNVDYKSKPLEIY
ncbi:hypothetical protein T492DRAFT_619040 [Pavlovales sp. CCMP2436]|nr:hypothetical protein T492DRAFT_619040 [Pavlovales sp. CCMP2436]